MFKTPWKQPPKAKIYEALSAVADGRVEIAGLRGDVTSSAGDKKYLIEWSEDGRQIASNDNASYYQGYFGYPIIAVLLVQGRLSFDPSVAKLLGGIPWKKLNTKHKRNYDKAIDEALSNLSGGEEARRAIENEVDKIAVQLAALDLEKGPVRRPPPPGR